ncbi:unnamed protein product [Rotaria sp. Silwood2]|nr:unnamed protein product [Rotaria sp. Silwood2]
MTIPILLEGHVKICYIRKGNGHIKSEYVVPKCQNCGELGLDNPECNRQRTNASSTGTLVKPAILITSLTATQATEPSSEHSTT